jgi:hypothetical protein
MIQIENGPRSQKVGESVDYSWTFMDACRAFIQNAGVSQQSKEQYGRYLQSRAFGPLANRPVGQVSLQEIDKTLYSARNRYLSPSTKKQMRALAKRMLEWAHNVASSKENVVEETKAPSEEFTPSNLPTGEPVYRRLPVSDLLVDPTYQRPLRPKEIARIAREYNPIAFGTLIVSVRNGQYFVMDGQQRLFAAKRMGWTHVPCEIHNGLTREHEAGAFADINANRGPMKAMRLWNAELVGSRPEALAIQEILKKHGLQVEKSKRDYTLECIGTIREIYRESTGPALLDETLGILIQAYGGASESLGGMFLRGVSIVVRRYRDSLNPKRLVRVLSKNLPQDFIRAGHQFTATGGHTSTGIANAIVQRYNVGLSTAKKLPFIDR